MTPEQTTLAHKVAEDLQGRPFSELASFIHHKICEYPTYFATPTAEEIIEWIKEHLEYVHEQNLELVYRPKHSGEHHVGVY